MSDLNSALRFVLGAPLLTLALVSVQVQADDRTGSKTGQAGKIQAALSVSPLADYRLYAVRVGTSSTAQRNLFIADRSMPKRIEVACSFWIIKGPERLILIDTGFFKQKLSERWQIKGYKDPVQALAEIGLRADQVTDVIVTHSHWDHIGALDRFGNARIWITRVELNSIRARNSGRLLTFLGKAKREKRLCITGSIESIAPSVVVVPVGLHTPGFQYVVVRTAAGIWVFASDLAPLLANFERRRASGQNSSAKKTLAVQDTMLELVEGDLKRIIPGHEPGIYDREDIVEINGPG